MNTKEVIAKLLLDIQAVFLRPEEPFTWASGIKSPIYCDNRLILSSPYARRIVKEHLVKLATDIYPDCEVIVGTATAGIPHAALVADMLELPMAYVRNDAKSHGRKNQVEGRVDSKQKCVLVEDLISTGGSVLEAAKTLRALNANVLGIISIFTYDLSVGHENFRKESIQNSSLTDYHTLCNTAVKEGYIKSHHLPKLNAFQKNPSNENWMNLI